MPTFAEICAYLDTLFPPSLAEPWDRDGPAVDPCPAREVTAAVVALDVTSPAIEYAAATGAQCIVTHHPLLFELPDALRAQDVLAAQAAALSAMRLSAARSGSLGSALVRGRAAGDPLAGCALRTRREGDAFVSDYVPVRPLPAGDDWFETVWHEYNSIHRIAEEETEHGRNHSPDARGL